MDVAGLSHERGRRSGAARRPSSGRERRRPRASVVRPESPPVGPGSSLSLSELAADLPTGDADAVAARPDAADRLQADYFKRLLTQSRRLIDRRIDGYRKAIAIADARGDVDAACSFRRIVRTEEQERQDLDDMIEKLRLRFRRRPATGAATVSARPRFVAG